jgi:hypothetical protein
MVMPLKEESKSAGAKPAKATKGLTEVAQLKQNKLILVVHLGICFKKTTGIYPRKYALDLH